MRIRGAALVLLFAAAPLAAQQGTAPAWDPDSWTADGWTVAPLDNLPSGQDMLRDQLRGQPLDTIERADPLVMRPVDPAPEPDPVIQTGTATAGAVLRGLDKVSGETLDMDLAPGQSARFGRIEVTLRECRFPADNPASDAFALLDISETRAGQSLFSGWMLASSPALNPLDDARYDVWVLRCKRA